MVRPPSFDRNGIKKGAWSEDEDNKLRAYVERYGHRNWRLVPICAGLARCGKSCRLRWVNYLRPGLKRGNFTKHEKDLIIKLHAKRGNKWSAIAVELPGRTDNEIKNYWHAHIMKRGKRKGAAVVKEQSSESNLCMTTDHDRQKEGLFAKNPQNVDAFDLVGQGHAHQGDILAHEAHQTCFTQLDADLLPTAAELHDFGLLQVVQSYESNCFDYSSDAGINSGAGSQGSFSSKTYGEDAFYDDLWS